MLGATFLLTAFRDVTEGIAVGVSFGSLLFMHRMAEFVESQISDTTGVHGEVAASAHALTNQGDVLIYHINGPLFFGVASTILDVLDAIDPQPRAFIIDFSAVPIIDGSAAESFFAFADKAHAEGKPVFVIGANASVRRTLIANGLEGRIARFAADEEAARKIIETGSSQD